MRFNYRILPILILPAALATGCSDDSKPEFYNGTGTLDIAIEVAMPQDIDRFDGMMPEAGDFAITMTDGSNNYTWDSPAEFNQGSRFLVGDYTLSVANGSFFDPDLWHTPVFAGETALRISEGERTSVTVTASMVSAMLTVTATDAFARRFDNCDMTVHPYGGGYYTIGGDEPGGSPIFVAPVNMSLTMVARGDSGPVNLPVAEEIATRRGCLTAVTVDYDDATSDVIVTAVTAGETAESLFHFTDEMLRGRGPEVVTAAGDLTLTEHTLPERTLTFTVSHERPVKSLRVTLESQSLSAQGAPVECDLFNPTPEQRRWFDKAGVTIPSPGTAGDLSLDLTPLLSMLTYDTGAHNKSLIGVVATDDLCRRSNPSTVRVTTLPVEMTVEKISPAVIGIDISELTIVSPQGDPSGYITLKSDGQPLDIVSSEETDTGRYRLRVRVPSGNAPVKIELYYDGNLKGEYIVSRAAPRFTMEVDPFASMAVVRVKADDPSLTPIIVDNIHMLVNGRMSELYQRDSETATLVVMNLQPSTVYEMRASLMNDIAADPDAVTMRFTTEATPDLPNPGFEDVKNTIKYKDMAQGGVYSQTMAEIFNCLNHTSFDLWTPTGWANTNAKTFNGASTNHNTWYMQPSVYSTTEAAEGDYAVDLVSVAFDPKGPGIKPYLQESTPYVPYSRNVPEIAYRAAGRLFLGTYEYNPLTVTERYNEGIPFSSRPLTLSGFYRYTPSQADVDDSGEVSVEVLGIADGREQVIASNRARLAAVTGTGYAAFNLPLTYRHFGVKATRLKIMFTSSAADNTIAAETATVRTLDNLSASASTGSRLRLDKITLAY